MVVITVIKLKSPFHFFQLANNSRKILQQLKTSQYLGYKSTGFWTHHYTMSLWPDEQSMKAFAYHDKHKTAMQRSAQMAKEIRTLKLDQKVMPKWKEAKALLEEKGKVISFN